MGRLILPCIEVMIENFNSSKRGTRKRKNFMPQLNAFNEKLFFFVAILSESSLSLFNCTIHRVDPIECLNGKLWGKFFGNPPHISISYINIQICIQWPDIYYKSFVTFFYILWIISIPHWYYKRQIYLNLEWDIGSCWTEVYSPIST